MVFHMKRVFWVVSALLLVSLVAGHGNILYELSLDFDPTLKANIIQAAQEHIGIDEEPIMFDFERELIVVKFDRDREYSVVIHPETFDVFGFRDDTLNTQGDVQLDQRERKAIAEQVLEQIPESYRAELKYTEEDQTYSGSYQYRWFRYVDDLVVADDYLEVEVDGATGDIIAWRLSPFFYKTGHMKTTPAISHTVATNIAELKFDGEPVDFDPVLVIYRRNPLWLTKIKLLYPIYVAIDALDGKVVFTGGLRFTIPEEYDYGRDSTVVPNEFINTIGGNT